MRSTSLAGCRATAGPMTCSCRSWEHHHLPDRLALVQQVESFVDLVERQASAHQTVDWHAAAAVQRHIARQVARRNAGTDVAALDRALLGDEVDHRQCEGR